MKNLMLYASVACGPLMLVPNMAAAQTAVPPAAAENPSQTDALQDIIVTAQRRSERLQDVPASVSAITQEALALRNVRTLQDLSATVPSLVTTTNVGYGSAPLAIRGVGGANGGGNVFADEPVATYLDEAFVSRPRFNTQDLLDVGGIEVLRGPQGTLYGRNSTAGALLIRSAEPTETLRYRFSGSAAEYDAFKGQGAVSGPLTANSGVLARLAVGYTDYRGWGYNRARNEYVGGSRVFSSRLFLRFKPTERLRIDLIGDYAYQVDHPAVIAVSSPANFATAANAAGTNVVTPYVRRPDLDTLLDQRLFDLNVETVVRTRTGGATLRADWDLGAVTLHNVTNGRWWLARGQQDTDGNGVIPVLPAFVSGSISNLGDNRGTFRDSQFSEELRLNSNGTGPFSYLAGLYYYHAINKLDPFDILNRRAGPGNGGTDVRYLARQETNSISGFVDASYRITPALKVTVGGRYTHETKQFTNTFNVTTLNTFDPPGPTLIPAGTVLSAPPTYVGKASFNNFSPRAVVDYKFSRDVLGYVSFTKGFKSGGFNAFSLTPSFAPEKINAYEVGLKTDLVRGRARVNLSAFHYDYTNLQIRTPVTTGGVGIETAQAAKVDGAELETNLVPFTGFELDGNVAWLNARFTAGALSSVPTLSYVYGTNPPTVLENVAGNRLNRAPRWQVNLSARYHVDVSPRTRAGLEFAFRHQSPVFFLETLQTRDTYKVGPWSEFDGRITLASPTPGWEIALFARNLTNVRRLTQITPLAGLPIASVNEPRTVGLQLSFRN